MNTWPKKLATPMAKRMRPASHSGMAKDPVATEIIRPGRIPISPFHVDIKNTSVS